MLKEWIAVIPSEEERKAMMNYGIFLVVHNGRGRKMPWKDPVTQTPLSFSELIEMLNRDAVCLIEKYPNVSALEVVGIDFLARGVHKTKAKP